MSRYAHKVRIEAPAAEIWAVMLDLESWPEWASQFKRLDRIDPGPLALNTRVRVTPKGNPASTWTITEYEEGRSFTWAASLMPGVRITGGHILMPDGNATTAEFWLEASGALGALLSPILRRLVFSRNTRAATEGLKRRVEGWTGDHASTRKLLSVSVAPH